MSFLDLRWILFNSEKIMIESLTHAYNYGILQCQTYYFMRKNSSAFNFILELYKLIISQENIQCE